MSLFMDPPGLGEEGRDSRVDTGPRVPKSPTLAFSRLQIEKNLEAIKA